MDEIKSSELPLWFDGKKVNEVLFCEDFLKAHPMKDASTTRRASAGKSMK